MNKLVILSFLILSSTNVFGSAQSPERAKCFVLQHEARNHKKWKSEYTKFLIDDRLNADERANLMRRSMTLLADRLERIQKAGKINVNNNLIIQARGFVKAYDAGSIDKAGGVKVMTSGLRNLEDEIDEALFQSNMKEQACQVLDPETPVIPSTSSPGRK